MDEVIHGVLYIPECSENLLSEGQLDERGIKTITKNGKKLIKKEGRLVATATRRGMIYFLDTVEDWAAECAFWMEVLHHTEPEELWHHQLGHISKGSAKMISNVVDGLEKGTEFKGVCESCIYSKAHRDISKVPMRKTTKKLERVHTDIWGPAPEPSINGSRYMLTLTDDYTRKAWTFFLRRRSNFFDIFKEWKARVENESKERIVSLRCDNAGEYISDKVRTWVKEVGITLETVVPYTPEQNGISERLNRALNEKANALREDKKLPARFWAVAMAAATYLRNRGPVRGRKLSPEEAWSGNRLTVDHLRVFGCTAYVYIPKEKRSKVDRKAWKGIFVGYMESPRIYLVYDPVRRKIMRATAVTFDESGKYNLGMTERRRPRKRMKTEVVPNEDVVVLTEEEEERQRSSAIPTTVA